MLPIGDWVERLKDAVEGLTVHGAADLAAARADHKRDALYVYPIAEDGGSNVAERGAMQRHTVRNAVLVALTNRRERRGESGLTELEQRREQIKEALAGWKPANADRPIRFVRGDLVGFTDGVLLWQDQFETSFWRRS